LPSPKEFEQLMDGSRHKRWLAGLVRSRHAGRGGDPLTGTDARDPLDTYYRDLRHLADMDERTNRPLGP
jgi:hypothetical protein